MGRDFSICNIESTYKPVSACMYTALSFIDNFDKSAESGTITLHELSQAIYVLNVVCEQLEYGESIQGDIVQFKYSENEQRGSILDNCTNAKIKLMEALSEAVLCKYDSVAWDYS